MNIDLTPAAQTQVELFRDIDTVENGFLIGTVMGKHIIITELLTANFNEKNIDEIYHKMVDKMGDQVIGVFFNNREPFLSEWFLEDVIMTINPQTEHPVCYVCEFEKEAI
jgi:hypothetical protein